MIRKLPRRRCHCRVLAMLTASAMVGGIVTASATSGDRAKGQEAAPKGALGPAVMAIVSLEQQRVSLYDAQGSVMRGPISSGQTGYETPVGIYSILQKKEDHVSNLYDDAAMPFMQRITWSGIALHAGALPGYRASHGCVRLPHGFAKRIFKLTRLGMRVVVARNEVAPVAIAHPLLFQPRPLGDEVARASATTDGAEPQTEEAGALLPDVKNWPARQRQLEELQAIAAEKLAIAQVASEKAAPLKAEVMQRNSELKKVAKIVRLAEAEKRKAQDKITRAERSLTTVKKPKALKAAEKAKAKAVELLAKAEARLTAANVQAQLATDALTRATEAAKVPEAAELAAGTAAKEARHKVLPVSVFISLKTQRLYIRQGFVPVLESPVTIRDPERPIGTHIYTALDYADGGNTVRWNVVSLARRTEDDEVQWVSRRRRDDGAEHLATNLRGATAALDRVEIPPEILTRINEFVWPGSSLIISDEEKHKETGNATDFVILISGEPQGGIKKRPRQQPDDDFYNYGGYDPYYSYTRPRRYDPYRYRPTRRHRPRKGGSYFGWW